VRERLEDEKLRQALEEIERTASGNANEGELRMNGRLLQIIGIARRALGEN
jgi:hypothetical protein